MGNAEKRRHRRTREYGPRTIHVGYKTADGGSASCEAKLWDFSEGGLGMDSPRPFANGEVIEIRAELRGPVFSVAMEAEARVAYCRETGPKRYRVGVAFIDAHYRRLDEDQADGASV